MRLPRSQAARDGGESVRLAARGYDNAASRASSDAPVRAVAGLRSTSGYVELDPQAKASLFRLLLNLRARFSDRHADEHGRDFLGCCLPFEQVRPK
jgi:hypothetical protein